MSQINMYVPEYIEEFIKNQAKKEGKSVSAYLTKLVEDEEKRKNEWGDFFERVCGKLSDDFPDEIEREGPEADRDINFDDI